MRELSGRVAVVTGAASGIGRGLALELGREGCVLVLADVQAARLEETAELVRGEGGTCTTHLVDVSDREAMRAFAAEVTAAHGKVHLLVNNAGITVGGTFEEQDLADWDRVIGVNLMGVVHGCKLFWDALMTADEARIVNISSVFGIVGTPTQSSYCAAKFAVRGLSEALWEETRGTHIGVTVVHPAGVATHIVADSRDYADGASIAKVNKAFAATGMPPRKAARDIVAGVKAGRSRVFVARGSRTMDRVKRLFPVAGNRFITAMVAKTLGLEERERALREGYAARRRELGFD